MVLRMQTWRHAASLAIPYFSTVEVGCRGGETPPPGPMRRRVGTIHRCRSNLSREQPEDPSAWKHYPWTAHACLARYALAVDRRRLRSRAAHESVVSSHEGVENGMRLSLSEDVGHVDRAGDVAQDKDIASDVITEACTGEQDVLGLLKRHRVEGQVDTRSTQDLLSVYIAVGPCGGKSSSVRRRRRN